MKFFKAIGPKSDAGADAGAQNGFNNQMML